MRIYPPAPTRACSSPGRSRVSKAIESVATGWLAGLNAVRVSRGQPVLRAPSSSATGALCRYVSNVETKNFQPVNITFGLLEPLPVELRKKYRNKRERHMVQVDRALSDWDEWIRSMTLEYSQASR